MITDKFGQLIFSESDLVDHLMKEPTAKLSGFMVDTPGLLERAAYYLDNIPDLLVWDFLENDTKSVPKFDFELQDKWHIPEEYCNMDIAAYVLSLCDDETQLQRCGEELLLYQERNLFSLLKFLHYLVITMTENKVIWGVGRGSSSSSYVLYKLGVHGIDSLYYQIPIEEFLR